jgi:hypothetical protein
MKNSQKGFASVILIIIAVVLVTGGIYFYYQRSSGPENKVGIELPSISNVKVLDDKGESGISMRGFDNVFFIPYGLNITWESSNISHVRIFLESYDFNGKLSSTEKLTDAIENTGKYLWELTPGVTRAYDGSYKIVVVSWGISDAAFSAQSDEFRLDYGCPAGVCDEEE